MKKSSPKNCPGSADSERGYLRSFCGDKGLNSYQPCESHIKRTGSTPFLMDKIRPEGHIVDRKHQWRGVQDLFGYVQDSDLLPENKELLYLSFRMLD